MLIDFSEVVLCLSVYLDAVNLSLEAHLTYHNFVPNLSKFHFLISVYGIIMSILSD